ncbi:DNA-protecting protein DprA [Luteibacter flocculans]|uniref:DNA-protecting protein DprA n=2 Tax=Luteibacter flocculans TaxID=2780091 RepID=A0ABY4TC05_9GAMM|nr:DNA-protecting protein DprA [Luteibacter flocculans]
MHMSKQSQAVLLLTAWLGKPDRGEAAPLAPREWGRFALWLKEQGHSPADLLDSRDLPTLLQGWADRAIDLPRIQRLLERGVAMGIALEKWERAGLWVITRSDPEYPSRLKRLLKTDAPPVLFGSGDRDLLDRGGIAVVGARDIGPEDLAFTGKLGGQIAMDGRSVVSGGARGADETAMLAALAQGGTVIGILADGLLRASSSAKYRSSLVGGNLVLISPFNPEAGFHAGNAMARNKYIYCLADAAIVIKSARGTGGTWNGAIETLKNGWVPVWVKPHADHASGNAALADAGAFWLPETVSDFDAIMGRTASIERPAAHSLFDARPPGIRESDPPPASELEADAMPHADVADSTPERQGENDVSATGPSKPASSPDLYEYFLLQLEAATRDGPATAEALQQKLGLVKTQLSEWLKRAVKEGRVEKRDKPVRYQSPRNSQLF